MPTKDINDAVPAIRDVWEDICQDFIKASPGRYLELACVYRSPQEQMALFKQGRTMGMNGKWIVADKNEVVTNADGYNHLSPHNFRPSRAIDVHVYDNQTGKYLTNDEAYAPLGAIAKRYRLVWGGSWHSIKDYDHLEAANAG